LELKEDKEDTRDRLQLIDFVANCFGTKRR
jgi:hypothetical protein